MFSSTRKAILEGCEPRMQRWHTCQNAMQVDLHCITSQITNSAIYKHEQKFCHKSTAQVRSCKSVALSAAITKDFAQTCNADDGAQAARVEQDVEGSF